MTTSTAKPAGEPRAKPVVWDSGPWKGMTEAEWIERVSRPATPQREYDEQGRFQPWIRREGAA